jgi:hypothetical protein
MKCDKCGCIRKSLWSHPLNKGHWRNLCDKCERIENPSPYPSLIDEMNKISKEEDSNV